MSPQPEPSRDNAPLREVALTFIGVTIVTVAISRIGKAPPLDQYVHVAVATLFLWLSLRLAQRDPRGVEHYGLSLGGFFDSNEAAQGRSLFTDLRHAFPFALRELGYALAVALVVFPPFALAFSFWHRPTHALTMTVPSDVLSYVLAQIVIVALPEEALFRGYFQTRLADVFPGSWTIRGRALPWQAIVAQALLFALMHFAVELDITRLSVFFPGLLFGALRSWRGGIGCAVFFHALCNLYSDLLVRGWL